MKFGDGRGDVFWKLVIAVIIGVREVRVVVVGFGRWW